MLFFPSKGSGLTAASLLNPMSPTPTDMLHGTCCAAIYFADSGPVTLKHPAAHFASGTTAPKVANTATSEDREKGTRHQVRPVRSLQFFFF